MCVCRAGECTDARDFVMRCELVQACSDGAHQVWLASEDTGAYGIDLGTNIASLLRRLACSPWSTTSWQENLTVIWFVGRSSFSGAKIN